MSIRILYLTFYILLAILHTVTVFAQPSISAIIPDVCAPGLNTAMEILAPAANKGSFGADGLYLNNPGDAIRVKTLRDSDSSSVIFSPFIVSWEGRVISIQAFVNPRSAGGPNPNSSDWSLLNNNFRIPICVTVNGIQSSIDTIYIVQPFTFGNRVSNSQTSIFGEGTWGKRSRRGAMIIDSMILPLNGKFEVSTNDCDPYVIGNQGYLPFTLIVKGNVQGNGGVISVNANKQNGGPGGGGGAGPFCDITNPTSSAGNGYTGGAPSGRNGSGIPLTKDYYGIQGISSGSPNSNNKISGNSITGVRGGECRAFEGGGGGTGHPYGMSGSGSFGSTGAVNGSYGGGTSPTDRLFGGGGGFRTDGASSDGINGGKSHGNRAVVPIAGGSGGATGNPRAGFGSITCSGYGGGGGGAISFHANSITNIIIEAKGASGEDNDPYGGGGSGGFIGCGARSSISSMNGVTSGGLGNTYGGEGRFRFEAPIFPQGNPNAFPIANQNGQESYRGVTIEYASQIRRNPGFQLGFSSGDSVRFFMKSNTGIWRQYDLIQIPTTSGLLNIPFDDVNTFPDSLYYLMAVQSNSRFTTINEYLHEPIAIISQSAGNILHIPTFPIIASDTNVQFLQSVICKGDTISQNILIRNTGSGALTIDSMKFKGITQGFAIAKPTLFPIIVRSGDSIDITVSFNSNGQPNLYDDSLVIFSNARNDTTWTIHIRAKKEVFELAYRHFDSSSYQRTFTMPIGCIGTTVRDTLFIINRTPSIIPADSIRLIGSVSWTLIKTQSFTLPNDSAMYIVQYDVATIQNDNVTIEVHHPLCDTIDVITIQGSGKRALLTANPSVLTVQNQPIGFTNKQSITVRNIGNAPATIASGLFGLQSPFEVSSTNPPLPYTLQPNDSIEFTVSVLMNSPGTVNDTLLIVTNIVEASCDAMLSIPLSATANLPSMSIRFGNKSKADPKANSYEIPILSAMTGTDSVLGDMTLSFVVDGAFFYPKTTSFGTMTSYLDVSGNRIVSITFNNKFISGYDSLLTIVSGIIQLDSMTSAPLNWLPVQWKGTQNANISFIDGVIELEVCKEGDGKRLILNGKTPLALKVFPNPSQSSDDVSIEFPIVRLGTYLCTIRDIHGRVKYVNNLEFNDLQSLGKNHTVYFNTDGLSSGTYFICVQFEGVVLTERLLVLP